MTASRIIARKKGSQVRLYSRPGNDLTHRFPLIVEALARLRSRSCIIDGEAVACDDNGVPSSFACAARRVGSAALCRYSSDRRTWKSYGIGSSRCSCSRSSPSVSVNP
jgi:ATP-dependent DNA ligase